MWAAYSLCPLGTASTSTFGTALWGAKTGTNLSCNVSITFSKIVSWSNIPFWARKITESLSSLTGSFAITIGVLSVGEVTVSWGAEKIHLHPLGSLNEIKSNYGFVIPATSPIGSPNWGIMGHKPTTENPHKTYVCHSSHETSLMGRSLAIGYVDRYSGV